MARNGTRWQCFVDALRVLRDNRNWWRRRRRRRRRRGGGGAQDEVPVHFEILSYVWHLRISRSRSTCLWVKKLKCTLVQALRLCTGRMAHRGSRGIALLFHDHGTRRGWGVSVTSQLPFTPEEDPVPIVQEAGWAPGPVWTGAENLAPTSIWSPDRPAHSQSLYRLSYPTHNLVVSHVQNVLCMWVQHIDSEPYCCLSVIDFIDETWLPQTFICLTYWKMSWRWAISIWWHCQCWVPEGDLRVTHLFLPLGLAKSHHILC